MKILITGTHCTGKSTLLEALKEHLFNYKFIGGVTREAKSFGLDINQEGSNRTQLYCACSDVLNILKNKDIDVVYDRSIIDTLIYTKYLYFKGQISKVTLNTAYSLYKEFNNSFDYIFWLRPEFKIVDDGVRAIDLEFQRDIDNLFDVHFDIEEFDNVYTLTGTVEQRVEQLKRIINGK